MPSPSRAASALLIALFATRPAAFASEHAAGAGLGVGGGVGAQYTLVGLQAAWFQPLPFSVAGQPLGLVASASYGVGAIMDEYESFDGESRATGGFSFFAAATWGRRHRAVLGAGWGALGRDIAPVLGFGVSVRPLYAPFAELGYEWLLDNGFFLRALPFGLVHFPADRARASSTTAWSFSTGIGWKLW